MHDIRPWNSHPGQTQRIVIHGVETQMGCSFCRDSLPGPAGVEPQSTEFTSLGEVPLKTFNNLLHGRTVFTRKPLHIVQWSLTRAIGSSCDRAESHAAHAVIVSSLLDRYFDPYRLS